MSVKKEKLWQIAAENFLLYSEGEKKHTLIRDIWDQVLNTIADMQDFHGIFDRAMNALKKAATASSEYDIDMVKFWVEQFYWNMLYEETRDKKRKIFAEIHQYRLSKRNPLMTASYESSINRIELKRKIYIAR